MSRRISIRCEITQQTILDDTLDYLGVDYLRQGENQYRFRSSIDGFVLLYGGLTLSLQEDGTYQATYDEDCRLSKVTLGKITQEYLRRYYLLEAMQQGDQVQREFVATGLEKDPLIEPGDIVIIATKG